MTRNIARDNKIYSVFGKYYGFKYKIIYKLHKNYYFKILDRKIVKLKYKKHSFFVRMYTRDIDFIEDIYIGKAWNDYRGEYDLYEQGDCNSYIDLGANVGLFSLMYGVNYPKRQIIALEPEEKNYQLLKRNTKDLDNVICLNNAIWYRTANVKVYESDLMVWSGPTDGGFYVDECDCNDKEGIKAITINDIVKKYNLENYLIKMDIEGAEYKIFECGDNEWTKGCKTFVIETHDRLSEQYNEKPLVEKLSATHIFQEQIGENKVFVRSR